MTTALSLFCCINTRSHASTSALEELPGEMLAEILRHLPEESDRAHLALASRTCQWKTVELMRLEYRQANVELVSLLRQAGVDRPPSSSASENLAELKKTYHQLRIQLLALESPILQIGKLSRLALKALDYVQHPQNATAYIRPAQPAIIATKAQKDTLASVQKGEVLFPVVVLRGEERLLVYLSQKDLIHSAQGVLLLPGSTKVTALKIDQTQCSEPDYRDIRAVYNDAIALAFLATERQFLLCRWHTRGLLNQAKW